MCGMRMSRRVKVKLLDFSVVREEANEYELEDGTRVKMKAVLEEVRKEVDEEGKPKLSKDGNPIYHFRARIQQRVIPKDRTLYMSVPPKPKKEPPSGIYR